MPTLDPLKTAIAVVLAVLLAASHWKAYHMGMSSVQAQWDKADKGRAQAENAAIMAAVRNNERKAEQDRLDATKLKERYENDIATGRRLLAAERLRINTAKFCDGPAVPTTGPAAGRTDAGDTGSRLLRPDVDETIHGLIEESERVAAIARGAQEFIREKCMK